MHAHLHCAGTVTQPQAELYYTQRTSEGGLLITEATCTQVVRASLVQLLGGLQSVSGCLAKDQHPVLPPVSLS